MAKPLKVAGVTISPAHALALKELAGCPSGSCAVPFVMPGGLLAALVQAGLAIRTKPDRLGGNRYAASEAARAFLAQERR